MSHNKTSPYSNMLCLFLLSFSRVSYDALKAKVPLRFKIKGYERFLWHLELFLEPTKWLKNIWLPSNLVKVAAFNWSIFMVVFFLWAGQVFRSFIMQITINVRQQAEKCPGKLNFDNWLERWNRNSRLSGSSQARPSLTCWWKGTPWWSMSTPRSRNTVARNMVWSTKWWTWDGESGELLCQTFFSFLIGWFLLRDEMTDEHMTTALCMNELRGCQKYSMGPNFIYFGAQK